MATNDAAKEERKRRLLAFLEDYRALVLKHKVWVDSCNCCHSPWTVQYDPYGQTQSEDQVIEQHLNHLKQGIEQ